MGRPVPVKVSVAPALPRSTLSGAMGVKISASRPLSARSSSFCRSSGELDARDSGASFARKARGRAFSFSQSARPPLLSMGA